MPASPHEFFRIGTRHLLTAPTLGGAPHSRRGGLGSDAFDLRMSDQFSGLAILAPPGDQGWQFAKDSIQSYWPSVCDKSHSLLARDERQD